MHVVLSPIKIMQALYEKDHIVANDTDANGNTALMNAIVDNDERTDKGVTGNVSRYFNRKCG